MSLKEWPLRIAAAAALATGFAARNVSAAILTVGNQSECTYANVQAAINALTAGGEHEIRINSNLYENSALTIENRKVRLVGGYASCSAVTPTGVSTLSGVGGGHDSVVTITGNSNDVILENLSIIKGDEVPDGVGGGVDFRGGGTLRVRASSISNNYAGYGGGISFTGTAATRAQLRIEAGTLILNNVAQYSGGGIRVEGNARLQITDDNVLISGNEARGVNPANNTAVGGYGGGIQVLGDAEADLGSPGFGNGGLIVDNTARYGGGISGNGNNGHNARVVIRLFTADASRPLRIRGNRATHTGGAIYLDDGSRVAGFDFRIDGNRAQEGAAIYTGLEGEYIHLNGGMWNESTRPTHLGAVPCSPAVDCNLIDGNIAETAAGQATTGAAILVQDGSGIEINRTILRKNRGGQVARNFGSITMVNSLIADNVVTGHLLRRESGPNALHVENSTIAGNSIGAAHVISASGDVVLVRSISWQPGRTTLAQSSGSRNVNNVLANEVISLGGGGAVSTIVNDDPLFVDAASGDYRPHAASTAVDFASSGGGPDLAGNMRAFDLPIKPNWNGTGDLGAYERVDMAPLVRNADFDGDLRLWDVQGSTTWVNENFVGRAGALRISKSGLVGGERVVGASHCVPLPGPGTYRLSGAGRAPGARIVGGGELPGDSLRIAWQLKPATGLNCGGTASAIGEINLGTQPTWHHAAAPAEITLLPSQWTRGARLLVQLVVENTDAFNAPIANGYFDGITLELAGNDTIFRNGFDD